MTYLIQPSTAQKVLGIYQENYTFSKSSDIGQKICQATTRFAEKKIWLQNHEAVCIIFIKTSLQLFNSPLKLFPCIFIVKPEAVEYMCFLYSPGYGPEHGRSDHG